MDGHEDLGMSPSRERAPAHDELLTASDLQRILKISRAKAYELMAAGVVPTMKIGRSVRVSARALDEWIARQLSGGEIL